jgi:small-conductance mechanosensitive channel
MEIVFHVEYIIIIIVIIIIQFNLFACRLNSPEANYKASTCRNEKTHSYKQYKNKAIIIIIIIIIALAQIKLKS